MSNTVYMEIKNFLLQCYPRLKQYYLRDAGPTIFFGELSGVTIVLFKTLLGYSVQFNIGNFCLAKATTEPGKDIEHTYDRMADAVILLINNNDKKIMESYADYQNNIESELTQQISDLLADRCDIQDVFTWRPGEDTQRAYYKGVLIGEGKSYDDIVKLFNDHNYIERVWRRTGMYKELE